ncbi:MAG: A/G-specific adenine glycosylase [Bacteroidota bacterium]
MSEIINIELSKKDIQAFQAKLLEWYLAHPRPLPWKETKNAYYIWLSEIILQQTRVAQGTPYYYSFVETFPTIQDLASAPEDLIMKKWEGLGYYSRARNLHTTAKYIVENHGGIFPNTYKEILNLKGVGPYTAAAIASFAFDLPYAVVDGNVYRILSRIFGLHAPIDQTQGKKAFTNLAQKLLPKEQAADFNQAIMNFGATQCTPKSPDCSKCPFVDNCIAHNGDLIDVLPVKSKKIKKRTRYFHYLIINNESKVYIRKRVNKDIWKHLFEFPLIESDELERNYKKLLASSTLQQLFKIPKELISVSKTYQHILTHQKIHAIFFELTIKDTINTDDFDWIVIERKKLNNFAFPKLIDCYLSDKALYLNL